MKENIEYLKKAAEVGDDCYCLSCMQKRKVKSVEFIPPKDAEVQTVVYKIQISCGHQLYIKLSNNFET